MPGKGVHPAASFSIALTRTRNLVKTALFGCGGALQERFDALTGRLGQSQPQLDQFQQKPVIQGNRTNGLVARVSERHKPCGPLGLIKPQ